MTTGNVLVTLLIPFVNWSWANLSLSFYVFYLRVCVTNCLELAPYVAVVLYEQVFLCLPVKWGVPNSSYLNGHLDVSVNYSATVQVSNLAQFGDKRQVMLRNIIIKKQLKSWRSKGKVDVICMFARLYSFSHTMVWVRQADVLPQSCGHFHTEVIQCRLVGWTPTLVVKGGQKHIKTTSHGLLYSLKLSAFAF